MLHDLLSLEMELMRGSDGAEEGTGEMEKLVHGGWKLEWGFSFP